MSRVCARLRVRDRVTLVTTVNHAVDPDRRRDRLGESTWSASTQCGWSDRAGRAVRRGRLGRGARPLRRAERRRRCAAAGWRTRRAGSIARVSSTLLRRGRRSRARQLVAPGFVVRGPSDTVVNFGRAGPRRTARRHTSTMDVRDGLELATPGRSSPSVVIGWCSSRTESTRPAGDDRSSLEVDRGRRPGPLCTHRSASTRMTRRRGRGARRAVRRRRRGRARGARGRRAPRGCMRSTRIDFDALRELAAHDFVCVDHRLLGCAAAGPRSVHRAGSRRTQTSESRRSPRRMRVHGRRPAVDHGQPAVDPDGGDVSVGDPTIVGVVDADGRHDARRDLRRGRAGTSRSPASTS